MCLLHWKCSNVYMGSLLSYLIVSLIWIGVSFAQTDQNLYFTNYPSEIQLGNKYIITWQGGDGVSPVNLALLRGSVPNVSLVTEITSTATGTYCDWTPDDGLAEADDYLLGIAQNNDVVYGQPISVKAMLATASATYSAMPTTSSAPMSSSTAPSTTSASSSTLVSEAATSTSSVDIINPTPTSSFDAPREEDRSLTVNDKVAIGIGIPIALLVLGTLGYWRAMKFFFHRKITGETKLPMYDGRTDGNVPSIVVGSGLRRSSGRNSTWSQAPSLWGASSRRSSAIPQQQPFGGSDTELLNTPPQSIRPPLRPSSQASARSPSALRMAWTPV